MIDTLHLELQFILSSMTLRIVGSEYLNEPPVARGSDLGHDHSVKRGVLSPVSL